MKWLLTILIILLLGLQYRLWVGQGSLAEINRLQQQIELQAEENALLSTRNEALHQEVLELQTGMDAIEERARSELGLIREGEIFYMIVDEKD